MENQINISLPNPYEKESGGLGKKSLTIKMPNLLLIAGNGRNVGKTTLACQIISFFAGKTEVVGLKISPHYHDFYEGDVVFKNDHVIIINENKTNTKDSSLMLKAGAKKVYFVMVKPDHFNEAVEHLIQILPDKLIVCESGGLHEHVLPGLFLMVKLKEEEIVKTHLLQHYPTIVNNDGENFDFDIKQLKYENHHINLKK